MEIAKHRFTPESISFLNRAAGQRGNVEEIANSLLTENLRDIKVQEELIDEYLKDFQVDTETIETVYELNRKYNQIMEKEEEVSRNINWKLKSFKWDNLFNYGENNHVNFDSLGGIIGIFGKNFSGKSSIIDGVLYTLFNTTSKNERKNLNIINQNKEYGSGELEIGIGDKIYNIYRKSTKYVKRLKGEETLEAKTDLNFEVCDMVTGETISLNGLTRTQTDANIRKHFGSLEDFLVSSLASQHGSLTFLEEGSTRRKEIIAKFLDLEQFDKKFKLAKEDSIDARGALKKFEDRNYDEDLSEALGELQTCREELSTNQSNCDDLEEEVATLLQSMNILKTNIESLPAEVINFTETKKQLNKKNNQLVSLKTQTEDFKEQLEENTTYHEKIKQVIHALKIADLNSKQGKIDNLSQELNEYETSLIGIESEILASKKKTALLEGIPCGDSYPTCKFIRDANAAAGRLPVLKTEHTAKQHKQQTTANNLAALNPAFIDSLIQKYHTFVADKTQCERNIESIGLTIERNESATTTLELEIRQLNTKIQEYNENKEVIENFEHLVYQRNHIAETIKDKDTELEKL